MRGCFTLRAARSSLLAIAWLAFPAVAPAATRHVAPNPKLPFGYDTTGAVAVGADPASVSGPAVLQFQGVAGASFDPRSGQAINLGQFVVAPSSTASGQPTTYQGTPFEVEIRAPEFDKTSSVPLLSQLVPSFNKRLSLKTMVENSLLLKGHLDGTVGGDGRANVTATVDSIKLGGMGVQSQDHVTHYAFPIRYNQLKLPSSWVMGASPTIPRPALAAAQTLAPSTTVVAPAPAAESFVVASPTPPTISGTPPAVITPTPTPEPSTIVVFATAFGGLVAARRRRKAR